MPSERDKASENPYEAPIESHRVDSSEPQSHSGCVTLFAGVYLFGLVVSTLVFLGRALVNGSRHPVLIVGVLVALAATPRLLKASVAMIRFALANKELWHKPRSHQIKRLVVFAGVPFLLFCAVLFLLAVIEILYGL